MILKMSRRYLSGVRGDREQLLKLRDKSRATPTIEKISEHGGTGAETVSFHLDLLPFC